MVRRFRQGINFYKDVSIEIKLLNPDISLSNLRIVPFHSKEFSVEFEKLKTSVIPSPMEISFIFKFVEPIQKQFSGKQCSDFSSMEE